MRVAIFGSEHGLPEAVFQLITGREPGQTVRDYISAVATADFPDQRLRELAAVIKPDKTTPDRPEFQMFLGMGPMWSDRKAGEVFGAMTAYSGFVIVARDISDFDDIYARIILTDAEAVDNLLPRIAKSVSGGHDDPRKLSLLERFAETLSAGNPLLSLALSDAEIRLVSEYGFLSLKPAVVAIQKEPELALPIERVSGDFQLALELSRLQENERAEMSAELGLADPVPELLSKLYKAAGLIHFFTPGPKEVRAWNLRRGAKAPEAAGRVHTDMERGFIRAMVARWDAVVSAGGWEALKKTGAIQREGKDYIVQDGDVIEVLFSR